MGLRVADEVFLRRVAGLAPNLHILGAAGTVTGSRFLVEGKRTTYLVDCGLFQGGHDLEERNWRPFPVDPQRIDAVLLTHAHVDHIGYLPRLTAQGFGGPIYATEATCALVELVLRDAARLQEQEAAYANRAGYSRHKPALPLYTVDQAEQALEHLRPIAFGQPLSLNEATAVWRPAGHILGSASLQLDVGTNGASRALVFSGDLGRFAGPMMKPPAFVQEADTLVLESTYGDRRHGAEPVEDGLEAAIARVTKTKGILLIPAFAVGRTQLVLYCIRKLQEEGRAPYLPVVIDSPMAVDASSLYCRFGDDHNLEANLLMQDHLCPLRCLDTRFVREVEKSKELNFLEGPAVVISASGMCSGGRILHHLKRRLPDGRNEVLLVGYQAQGTRGRRLLEGAKSLRIHGQEIPVRARVTDVSGLSAHADRDEILHWLSGFRGAPAQTLLVHGEPPARAGLRQSIAEKLGWEATEPAEGFAATL